MKNMMKKTLTALIVVSLVLAMAGCGGKSGGSSISGTYVDVNDPGDYFTFTGNTYTGVYGGGAVSGTFTVADKLLIAERESFSPFRFTIHDKDTIETDRGYVFKKK